MQPHKKHAWIREVYDLIRSNTAKTIGEHFACVVRLAKRTAVTIDADQLADGPFISFVVILCDTSKDHLQESIELFPRATCPIRRACSVR